MSTAGIIQALVTAGRISKRTADAAGQWETVTGLRANLADPGSLDERALRNLVSQVSDMAWESARTRRAWAGRSWCSPGAPDGKA